MQEFRSFLLRVFIDAPVGAVYSSWTKSGELEKWFLMKAKFTKPDGSACGPEEGAQKGFLYRWEWAEGTTEEGLVTVIDAPHSLAFSFGKGVEVAVALDEIDGRTHVELQQTNVISDSEQRAVVYVDCLQGWTFFLTNLKSVLEGGRDLREKRPNGRNFVNV